MASQSCRRTPSPDVCLQYPRPEPIEHGEFMPTRCMQSATGVPTPSLIEQAIHSNCVALFPAFLGRVAFFTLFCLFPVWAFGQTVTVTVGSNGTATIIYTPPTASTAVPAVVTSTPPTVTIAASSTAIAPGGQHNDQLYDRQCHHRFIRRGLGFRIRGCHLEQRGCNSDGDNDVHRDRN